MRERWRKLRGDLAASRGRVALMVGALALSLVAIGAVLGAHQVLEREIAASYAGTRPAEATLELTGGVDAALLAQVRALPEVAEADAREVVTARLKAGGRHHAGMMQHLHPGAPQGEWKPLLLFVIPDFNALRLDRFRPESGAWPPPRGAILLERAALSIVGAGPGATVAVKTAHGRPRPTVIAGLVHDPGLAPAWQEQVAYAYATPETLAALGESPVLHDLRVRFRPSPATTGEAEECARRLAAWLIARGHAVDEIRVPGLNEHPHQSLMDAALVALLAFALLLLLLGAALIAAILSAMLARQVREIGVMKAIGARTGQLAVLYAAAVGLIGLAAFLLALPLGIAAARALAGAGAVMLNIDLADRSIPIGVFAVQAGAAILVPLAAAAFPIRRAARLTVRAALDQHGARSGFARPAPAWLPLAARNALRRPGRLALTLLLLVAGGAMAMTALHMEAAYRRTVERLPEVRGDDLEIRLAEPAPVELAAALARVDRVRTVEAWGLARAAFARPAELDVVATYPDGGHGRFVLLGPPAGTALLRLPIAAGRWLEPGDTDALVVNSRLARSRRLAPGDRVSLSLDGTPQRMVVRQPDSGASGGSPVGTPSSWTVVGITDEIPPMAAYTTDQALARATRTEGRARLLRIATEPGADLRQVTRALEEALAENRATPLAVMPFERLYRAIEAHLVLFVRIALLLSAVIGLVGLVGLATAIGVGVAERTREIGVLKAIGASGGRVARWIVAEAALIGAVSWLLAAALSIPLAFGLVSLLNAAGALPASFAISPVGLAIWLPIAVAGSAAAALVPARRAARLTVKDALAEV